MAIMMERPVEIMYSVPRKRMISTVCLGTLTAIELLEQRFQSIRNAFGKSLGDLLYSDDFDFDNSGVIGTSDFNSFRSRFGRSV